MHLSFCSQNMLKKMCPTFQKLNFDRLYLVKKSNRTAGSNDVASKIVIIIIAGKATQRKIIEGSRSRGGSPAWKRKIIFLHCVALPLMMMMTIFSLNTWVTPSKKTKMAKNPFFCYYHQKQIQFQGEQW